MRLLPKTHINATVYPRGYLTRRDKYLPLGVNLMHVNRALASVKYLSLVIGKWSLNVRPGQLELEHLQFDNIAPVKACLSTKKC